MNYMPEVLKMLGIEVGEKFNIEESTMNPYHFDDDYILINSRGNLMEYANIVKIMRGAFTIEKLPWKPKDGHSYYCIDEDGENKYCIWRGSDMSYYRYNSGNCFQTVEEITDEIKQRILSEMKEKYENE